MRAAPHRQAEWQDKKRAQGRCPTCGRKSRPPYVVCPKCRAKALMRYYARKAQAQGLGQSA